MLVYKKRKMIPFITWLAYHRKQFIALGILIIIVLCGVGFLSSFSNSFFQRYLGEISAFKIFLLSSILSFLALSYLLSQGWFAIYKRYPIKSLILYKVLTLIFASIAIGVDLLIMYPEDMNMLFPESLLFYPTIAFLVEILFHIVPVSVLLLVTTTIFKNVPYSKLLLICILIVAMLEPTYQVLFMGSYPTWSIATVWVNLFLFNTIQLLAFKNFGFMSMYALRLLYYLVWHICWGSLRLELIFNS